MAINKVITIDLLQIIIACIKVYVCVVFVWEEIRVSVWDQSTQHNDHMIISHTYTIGIELMSKRFQNSFKIVFSKK